MEYHSISSYFAIWTLTETLRCPVVDPYTLECTGRLEHLCVSDGDCAEGSRCCPSAGDQGCTHQCRKAEVLSE